ncbi:MAG: hypothetical protein ABI607_04075 [Betaproteobacteria bacterium]
MTVVVGLVSPTLVPAQTAPMATPAVPVQEPFSWSFGKPQSANAEGWTAERGTITPGDGELRLQPDANRRVILLSPSGLPEVARDAEEFVLGVTGTGLQRVRIQVRRDVRGGWITIADASGAALREVTDGYAIKRTAGARSAPIERLRFELQFRTTNARALKHISIKTGPS